MVKLIPYEDYGGEGITLHFAHGNAYPPGTYQALLGDLSAHYRVLAVHHRPLWPGSRPDEIAGWGQIADDLVRFFEQEKLSDVIGVGHSLGAVTTMMAAVQRPSLFRALVLIDPVFLTPEMLESLATMKTELPLVVETRTRRNRWDNKQQAFDHFRAKRVFSRFSDQALRDYVAAGLKDNGEGGLQLRYPALSEARIYASTPLGVWEQIPKIQHPTLALRGAESDTLWADAWLRWQKIQEEATFVELAGCGHLLPMEKPHEVASLILKFGKFLV